VLEVDLLERELVLERRDLLERERVLDRERDLPGGRRENLLVVVRERVACDPPHADGADAPAARRHRERADRPETLLHQPPAGVGARRAGVVAGEPRRLPGPKGDAGRRIVAHRDEGALADGPGSLEGDGADLEAVSPLVIDRERGELVRYHASETRRDLC